MMTELPAQHISVKHDRKYRTQIWQFSPNVRQKFSRQTSFPKLPIEPAGVQGHLYADCFSLHFEQSPQIKANFQWWKEKRVWKTCNYYVWPWTDSSIIVQSGNRETDKNDKHLFVDYTEDNMSVILTKIRLAEQTPPTRLLRSQESLSIPISDDGMVEGKSDVVFCFCGGIPPPLSPSVIVSIPPENPPAVTTGLPAPLSGSGLVGGECCQAELSRCAEVKLINITATVSVWKWKWRSF